MRFGIAYLLRFKICKLDNLSIYKIFRWKTFPTLTFGKCPVSPNYQITVVLSGRLFRTKHINEIIFPRFQCKIFYGFAALPHIYSKTIRSETPMLIAPYQKL
jgi:hypothetical protein